jgi:glycerate 2-kinase
MHACDAPVISSSSRAILSELFQAAVTRALPATCIPPHLPPPPSGRTVVVGAGKAAASMALAVERAWPQHASLGGLVITRYGHVVEGCSRIEVTEAAHPVPDEAGLRATERVLDQVRGLRPEDLVLALISGGASALLTLPRAGITLEDKRAVTSALLASGASIAEINAVRKALSAVKGGRLAAACAPARVCSLLLSDVPGDAPSLIGSGPTVADDTAPGHALEVLTRYAIHVPGRVREALAVALPLGVIAGDVHLIATPRTSLEAAADAARARGITPRLLGDAVEGDSAEVGRAMAARALARRDHAARTGPEVLLFAGETTVTLHGPSGRGGREATLALAAALALDGAPGISLLAADTDGIDGSEDNAGALVFPDTLVRARALRLSAADALARHDAYPFFHALSDLVITGPTCTNVNGFHALLIE